MSIPLLSPAFPPSFPPSLPPSFPPPFPPSYPLCTRLSLPALKPPSMSVGNSPHTPPIYLPSLFPLLSSSPPSLQVKEKLGLDMGRYCATGAAPLSADIQVRIVWQHARIGALEGLCMWVAMDFTRCVRVSVSMTVSPACSVVDRVWNMIPGFRPSESPRTAIGHPVVSLPCGREGEGGDGDRWSSYLSAATRGTDPVTRFFPSTGVLRLHRHHHLRGLWPKRGRAGCRKQGDEGGKKRRRVSEDLSGHA